MQTISGEAILLITRVWRQDWPVSHTRPLLAPGPLRKPVPEFTVGQTVTVPYGALATIAAVRAEYIAVYVPGLGKAAVRGYERKTIEALNPAPEQAVAA